MRLITKENVNKKVEYVILTRNMLEEGYCL